MRNWIRPLAYYWDWIRPLVYEIRCGGYQCPAVVRQRMWGWYRDGRSTSTKKLKGWTFTTTDYWQCPVCSLIENINRQKL